MDKRILNKVTNIDWIKGLKELPSNSVNMCLTSPPYWGVRDYGIEGQLGREPHFDMYIFKLLEGFREVRRVLVEDGTCWVNIGDSYVSGTGRKTNPGMSVYNRKGDPGTRIDLKDSGYKDKCLAGIPFRFVLGMIDDGWVLRNTIIWHKNRVMPTSAKDRFTVDFEYVFFFAKNSRYYFSQQTEPAKKESVERYKRKLQGRDMSKFFSNPKRRNMRTVWNVNPKPYKGHHDVFPPGLIRPMIRAGCPENGIVLDPFMGSGTVAEVAWDLNRFYVGFELNPDNYRLILERLR